MIRDVVIINEEKCDGCGNCVTGCPEGALKVIDGKARLVSGILCDGLGACIGECPKGAISVEKIEEAPYDEEKVMDNVLKQGENTVIAHLKHLHEHGQKVYLEQAVDYLKNRSIKIPDYAVGAGHAAGGCPGSRILDFFGNQWHNNNTELSGIQPTTLRQWPVQMRLISPFAPYFKGADVLFAADCVAFAMGNFHAGHLKGRSLAIACPKLDADTADYEEKITAMIDEAKINTLTVMMMEVPCCVGLLLMAQRAASRAKRKIPIKAVTVSLKGEVLNEEWVV